MINLFKPPTREVDIQIESATEPTGYKIIKYKLESPTFDLRLARRSLLLEGMVHVIMLLFPSPASLYVLGVFGTCGAGFPPAMQSVILSLYIHNGGKENGKVFGALGVIQILWYVVICVDKYSRFDIRSQCSDYLPALVWADLCRHRHFLSHVDLRGVAHRHHDSVLDSVHGQDAFAC